MTDSSKELMKKSSMTCARISGMCENWIQRRGWLCPQCGHQSHLWALIPLNGQYLKERWKAYVRCKAAQRLLLEVELMEVWNQVISAL